MSERGFIALTRGILDHPVVGAEKPFSRFEAWAWLLFEAAWKPRRVSVKNGQTRAIVELKRGQLSHSRSYMAQAWGWTEKRVRTFLRRLEREGQIELQTGQHQTIVTVCNYDHYQIAPPDRGQQTGRQGAGKGPEEEQGNKETKNKRPLRSAEPEGFAEWFGTYPRKVARHGAARAYGKLVPAEITGEALLELTKSYARQWARKPKSELNFCPHPATWLNGRRFLDERAETRVTDAKKDGPLAADESRSSDFTDDAWLDVLELYRAGEPWAGKYWGPAPGQPGCRVPARLLVSPASNSADSEPPNVTIKGETDAA